MSAAAGRQDVKDFFDANDPSCWIEPGGKVHFVEGSHSQDARRKHGDHTGGRGLEDKGWLHVSYSSVFLGYNERLHRDVEPTQAQLDALFDISTRVVEATKDEENYLARKYRAWIAAHQPKESM